MGKQRLREDNLFSWSQSRRKSKLVPESYLAWSLMGEGPPGFRESHFVQSKNLFIMGLVLSCPLHPWTHPFTPGLQWPPATHTQGWLGISKRPSSSGLPMRPSTQDTGGLSPFQWTHQIQAAHQVLCASPLFLPCWVYKYVAWELASVGLERLKSWL